MDNQGSCHFCGTSDAGHACAELNARLPIGFAAGFLKLTDFRHFSGLAWLLLRAGHRDFLVSGSRMMAKIEAYAFTFGIILTGLLSLAAVPLA